MKNSISTIIPNYNHASYLKKRIQSILKQTLKPTEIIFLDDFSTDNSLKVAEKYLKKGGIPYEITTNSSNSGSVFKQWKKGIKKTSGDYIWIAESDDAAHSQFLEKLLAPLEKDNSIGLAYSETTRINDRNYLIDPGFHKTHYTLISENKWNSDYSNSGLDETQNSLFIMNTIPNVSGVLFRKKALLTALENIEQYKLSGDWKCYLNILEHSNIAYIAEELNYNRIHKKRTTASLDTTEVYFNESLKIAESLLKKYTIPESSKTKYIYNFFRQLSHCPEKQYLKEKYEPKLLQLFSRELVEKAEEEYADHMKHNPLLKNDLKSRLNRINLQKVFNRCTRTKI